MMDNYKLLYTIKTNYKLTSVFYFYGTLIVIFPPSYDQSSSNMSNSSGATEKW